MRLRLHEKQGGGAQRRLVKDRRRSGGKVLVYSCANHELKNGCKYTIRVLKLSDGDGFRVERVDGDHHPECWSMTLKEAQRCKAANLTVKRAGPGTTDMVGHSMPLVTGGPFMC